MHSVGVPVAPSWPPQLGQRRGDGGDCCQCNGVERHLDDWHRGWQTATMKVRWCVSPINVLLTSCQPFPVPVFFLSASISSTRQTRRSSRGRTYISLACNASSHSPTASRGIPSPSTTPAVQPSTHVHRAHSTLLRCPKPSQPGPGSGPGYELCAGC